MTTTTTNNTTSSRKSLTTQAEALEIIIESMASMIARGKRSKREIIRHHDKALSQTDHAGKIDVEALYLAFEFGLI